MGKFMWQGLLLAILILLTVSSNQLYATACVITEETSDQDFTALKELLNGASATSIQTPLKVIGGSSLCVMTPGEKVVATTRWSETVGKYVKGGAQGIDFMNAEVIFNLQVDRHFASWDINTVGSGLIIRNIGPGRVIFTTSGTECPLTIDSYTWLDGITIGEGSTSDFTVCEGNKSANTPNAIFITNSVIKNTKNGIKAGYLTLVDSVLSTPLGTGKDIVSTKNSSTLLIYGTSLGKGIVVNAPEGILDISYVYDNPMNFKPVTIDYKASQPPEITDVNMEKSFSGWLVKGTYGVKNDKPLRLEYSYWQPKETSPNGGEFKMAQSTVDAPDGKFALTVPIFSPYSETGAIIFSLFDGIYTSFFEVPYPGKQMNLAPTVENAPQKQFFRNGIAPTPTPSAAKVQRKVQKKDPMSLGGVRSGGSGGRGGRANTR